MEVQVLSAAPIRHSVYLQMTTSNAMEPTSTLKKKANNAKALLRAVQVLSAAPISIIEKSFRTAPQEALASPPLIRYRKP